jgi:hypothetical protein
MNTKERAKDNIFNADHRSKMIAQYGYTDAMFISVDGLCFEATMEAEYSQRDSKATR